MTMGFSGTVGKWNSGTVEQWDSGTVGRSYPLPAVSCRLVVGHSGFMSNRKLLAKGFLWK